MPFSPTTLVISPAQKRKFWLPAWAFLEDIDALFWVPPSTIRQHTVANFADTLVGSRGH
jgi:hypothetical protein